MKTVRFIEIISIKLTNYLTVLNPNLSSRIISTKNHVFNSNIFKRLNCGEDSFLENNKLN